MVIKFRIGGSLRFLSHAETLRVFQRACVRAGINLKYSQGFNPRPRMSLPLPRPVGVESEDELLALRMHRDPPLVPSAPYERRTTNHEQQIRVNLSAQLPEGCELISVSVADAHTSFQPCSATYVLAVRQEYLVEKLRATIEHLLASESLNVQRRIGKKNSKLKNVDVRGFLSSIELDNRGIIVECGITSAGSIRIQEVLELLGLDEKKLASPIRRTCVQWQDV